MSMSLSARRSSADRWVLVLGQSADASSVGFGVRWTMEWRVKRGESLMKGMWKILAESCRWVRKAVAVAIECCWEGS